MTPMTFILGVGRGMLGFMLKHWVWFALAAALIYARHTGIVAAERAAQIQSMTVERDTAVANARAWKETADQAQQLSRETLKARAQERADLVNLARELGTTKQGIANAPGADTPFRYSDPVYRFMRAHPGSDRAPASADPGVVSR